MDNPAYQRFDYAGVIRRLYIQSGRFPRIPGMHLNITLKWWQVVGVDGIINIKAKGLIRGCVLTDKVGLGKTYKIAGTMLVVSATPPSPFLQFLSRSLSSSY